MTDRELFGNSEQLDTISRRSALDTKNIVHIEMFGRDFPVVPVATLKKLPSAQSNKAEIQKMQDIEQAMIDKAYECGKQDAVPWIPCKERLPDPGVNVLVDVADISAGDRFPLIDKICEDGEWLNCDGSEWLALAWMPIPDPWKGEKE